MKLKKIYIEITNICNLNCSFCSKTGRRYESLSPEQFEEILKKIDKYTDYLYLHVKGEPLLHQDLDEILALALKYHKKVCLTTNGTLLKDKLSILQKYPNIYQINISLHSENNEENYLEDILEAVSKLKYPYISYRFWTFDHDKLDSKTNTYLNKIKDFYEIDAIEDKKKLKDKIYLSLDNKFTWPTLASNYLCPQGFCRGGKDHLAILSDGTVTICCLDASGASNLGNIFTETFEDILKSTKYQNVVHSFRDNKAYLDICKHCSYKERFSKNK